MSYSRIIYKYTSPSNKIYIRQSINPSSRRQDFNNLNTHYGGIKIDNARKKYSPKSFKYEILSYISTETEPDLVEQYYGLSRSCISNACKSKGTSKGYHWRYKDSDNIEQSVEVKVDKRSLPVIQYILSGEFIQKWKSSKMVSKVLGIHVSNIQACCNGKAKTSNDFIWRYSKDVNLNIECNGKE